MIDSIRKTKLPSRLYQIDPDSFTFSSFWDNLFG